MARLGALCAALLLSFHVLAQAPVPESPCAAPAARDDGWTVAAPNAAGFDESILCSLDERFASPERPNIHAVLVVRSGKLVFERYYAGHDERWGRSLGRVQFGPDTLHDLRSISKSVTALLLGIAIDRGFVRGVDEPVMKFFPEHSDLRTPERDRILLRHALTMSTGFAWNEDLPYTDPANSEIRMIFSPTPIRYALEQPIVAAPGEVYRYSGGATALIGAAVQKATGQPLDVFARESLFEPLGITSFEWVRMPFSGEVAAASGLRLKPRDLAKVGQLILAEGSWNGRQIVPAAWVREMTSPKLTGNQAFFYGYQWWLGRSLVNGRELRWAAGFGLGGQRLFIVPELDLATVVLAGSYGSSTSGTVPLEILNHYVLRAARHRSQ